MNFSSTDVGGGIRQVLTNTAVGTMVLVQEYSTLNPTSMVDLMLQELTKEEINYGYVMKKESVQRPTGGGEVLSGVRATVTCQGVEKYYEVMAHGRKDEGYPGHYDDRHVQHCGNANTGLVLG